MSLGCKRRSPLVTEKEKKKESHKINDLVALATILAATWSPVGTDIVSLCSESI